jgi:hypothetical protein
MRILATLGLAIGAASALTAAPHAAQTPATDPVVATVSHYVEEFRKQFSALVCEERQTQKLIKPDERISKTREIVSDLMFVKVGSSWVPQVFRDVLSVDGKPVRNRDDRLRKLFVDGKKNAVEQAQAIAKENGRYNLGVSRAGNSPLLPILLFDPHIAGRFSFVVNGHTLTFSEEQSPTFMGFSRNGGPRGNLPAKGTMEIDPATGAVRAATLTAEAPDAPVSTTFVVTYAEEPALKMLVPTAMIERYHLPAKPRDDRFESKATYSSFRRFQVVVNEIIK